MRPIPTLCVMLTLASLVFPDPGRGQAADSAAPILTTAIEYLEDRFPEGPRGLVHGFGTVRLSEAAVQRLAERFGAGILHTEPVLCRGAPQVCWLADDYPTAIQAAITERGADSAIAEVTLYQAIESEVFYHFVRLELSRRGGSWTITDVLFEVIT